MATSFITFTELKQMFIDANIIDENAERQIRYHITNKQLITSKKDPNNRKVWFYSRAEADKFIEDWLKIYDSLPEEKKEGTAASTIAWSKTKQKHILEKEDITSSIPEEDKPLLDDLTESLIKIQDQLFQSNELVSKLQEENSKLKFELGDKEALILKTIKIYKSQN
ncbi:MAG: hypothetical protein JKY89_01275 [Immundisolibacteraceae bacterium]|nr:hypothetical protein [Immundisolibacteraceae bacterium]